MTDSRGSFDRNGAAGEKAEQDDAKTEVSPKAETENAASLPNSFECAVCLQPCLHPVKLPCGHIFCFLCVKGVAYQSKRCAMCRQEIPSDFLFHPNLIDQTQLEKDTPLEDGYQWFYEGRNGWWQYDERTSIELESAYKRSLRSCELLIAGFLYVVDFDQMLQFRRSDPARRRRIKRDLASIPKKGVAGLRLEPGAEEHATYNLLSAAASRAALSPNCLSPSQTPQAPSNTPQTPRSPPSPAPDVMQDGVSREGDPQASSNPEPLLGHEQITSLLDGMIVFYNLDEETIDWNTSDSSLSDNPSGDAV